MSLRLCVLGSGSSGNCTYVASDHTHVLIDAGLSGREIAQRLESIGARLSDVTAVCVTHEHDDHISSLSMLQRKYGIALYANAGTIEAIRQSAKRGELRWNVFATGYAFSIGDLTMEPFSVPHDSYDPVGFVVSTDDTKTGVVTDMGMVTSLIRERLRHCQALVIESNHDEQLLKDARRPWPLKQRIAGRQGHLSNSQTGQLLSEVAGPHLAVVLLAHLSAECNRHDIALKSARQALTEAGYPNVAVKLTYPDKPSEDVRL